MTLRKKNKIRSKKSGLAYQPICHNAKWVSRPLPAWVIRRLILEGHRRDKSISILTPIFRGIKIYKEKYVYTYIISTLYIYPRYGSCVGVSNVSMREGMRMEG